MQARCTQGIYDAASRVILEHAPQQTCDPLPSASLGATGGRGGRLNGQRVDVVRGPEVGAQHRRRLVRDLLAPDTEGLQPGTVRQPLRKRVFRGQAGA